MFLSAAEVRVGGCLERVGGCLQPDSLGILHLRTEHKRQEQKIKKKQQLPFTVL